MRRRDVLSIPKLKAEGAPAEIQIVLGWKINTRTLTLSLSDNKLELRLPELRRLARQGRATFKEIESLVERLGHASYAVSLTRHFMDRLQRTIAKSDTRKSSSVILSPEAIEDMTLWETFLLRAHQGISINLLVTRQPSRLCWSDACPFGIGGYSLTTGSAWRVRIPKSTVIHGHPGINNLLEFLGMVVNVWLECKHCTAMGDKHACILALGDNTSALGWLHKSASLAANYVAHAAHLTTTRHLATVVLQADCCIASQHIRGVHNVVADLLSYCGNSRGNLTPSPPMIHLMMY